MAEKRLKKAVYYVLAAVLFVLAVLSVKSRSPWNTYDTIELVNTLMLCALVAMLKRLPLNLLSYIMLISLMITEKAYMVFFAVPSCFAIFFLLDLIAVLWLQTGRIKEYFTEISVVSMCAVILIAVYDAATTKLIPLYYDIGRLFLLSAMQKAVLITVFGGVVVVAFTAVVKLTSKLFNKNREKFLFVEKRFSGLWAYVLVIIMILLILFDMSESISRTSFYETGIFRLLIIFAVAVYICLLFKVASIREKMDIAKNAENELGAYSNDLETTIEDMKDIRHDVKNLLLTMGGFVEKSDDREMKKFYSENIVPFMQNALARSDLQAKLSVLSDNRLKSFLYYKVTEKLEQGVNVTLDITSSAVVGCGDIVRLLGIFIDNAAEEALLCEGRHMRLGISDDKSGTSFIIVNDVRDGVRERGVIAGTTEKGLGRGRGLLIAKRIINNYDNLILNSYFTDTQFAQCLIILKNTV